MQFQEIKKGERNEVYFTYSVKWKESDIRWASRWDIYLNMADVQIHWFSIVNSVVVVFFLSGIIGSDDVNVGDAGDVKIGDVGNVQIGDVIGDVGDVIVGDVIADVIGDVIQSVPPWLSVAENILLRIY